MQKRIGESVRENDYNLLENRIIESGLNPDNHRWYLDLRRFSPVPHAGFGLGVKRLIQFVTGMQNIRVVIPFTISFKNVEF